MAYFKYNRFWDDTGLLKWDKTILKQPIIDNSLSYDDVLQENLSGCDLKSDVVNVSWMIQKDAITLKHFTIANTVSWDWTDNILTVYSEDQLPVKLLFFSVAEASKANYRLFLIMNGNSIIGCNDDTVFYCGKPNQLVVHFDQGA